MRDASPADPLDVRHVGAWAAGRVTVHRILRRLELDSGRYIEVVTLRVLSCRNLFHFLRKVDGSPEWSSVAPSVISKLLVSFLCTTQSGDGTTGRHE